MRIRIPNKDEILVVAGWGAVRLLLATGELALYSWKQLSRLSLHCATGAENIFREALVRPHQSLLYSDLNEVQSLKQIEQVLDEPFELFRWERFREEPDTFPHIRIIAKSGMGKTTLARYLMHLFGGKQAVITPKAKPTDWTGLEVYGKKFNYEECEWALLQLKELMYANYELIDQGLTPEMSNIALDEWRLIKQEVAVAGELVKEFITVARDGKIRLLALAQGEQVETWGLQGESDLGECFSDIRLGEFAIEYARKIKAPQSVRDWLQRQKRPCMVGRYPAEVPNLSGYQFNTAQSPLQRRFTGAETAEMLSPTVIQLPRSSGNEVSESAEMLLYRAFRAFQGSESDFIKQVWGSRSYGQGKSNLEELKKKFEAN